MDSTEEPTFEQRAHHALAGLFMLPAQARALILDICRELDRRRIEDGKPDDDGSGAAR
ncbi:MAG TPA: hypothetical protein VGE10_01690 [Zeimonas sp.]